MYTTFARVIFRGPQSIYAVDAVHGSTLWSRYPDAVHFTEADSDVCVYMDHQDICVLDAATGRLRWRTALPDAFTEDHKTHIGTPMPGQDVVIVPLGTAAHQFSKKTGAYQAIHSPDGVKGEAMRFGAHDQIHHMEIDGDRLYLHPSFGIAQFVISNAAKGRIRPYAQTLTADPLAPYCVLHDPQDDSKDCIYIAEFGSIHTYHHGRHPRHRGWVPSSLNGAKVMSMVTSSNANRLVIAAHDNNQNNVLLLRELGSGPEVARLSLRSKGTWLHPFTPPYPPKAAAAIRCRWCLLRFGPTSI